MGIRTAFSPLSSSDKSIFEREEIIFNEGGSTKDNYSYEKEDFPKGEYTLELVSSAGTAAAAANGIWYFASGGSGAVWRGTFKNPKKQKIKISVELSGAASLELGGIRMLNLTPGTPAVNSGTPGKGGTLTIDSSLIIIESEISENGANGRTGNSFTGGNSYTISPSAYRPWGDCRNNSWAGERCNGGIYLKFIK